MPLQGSEDLGVGSPTICFNAPTKRERDFPDDFHLIEWFYISATSSVTDAIRDLRRTIDQAGSQRTVVRCFRIPFLFFVLPAAR